MLHNCSFSGCDKTYSKSSHLKERGDKNYAFVPKTFFKLFFLVQISFKSTATLWRLIWEPTLVRSRFFARGRSVAGGLHAATSSADTWGRRRVSIGWRSWRRVSIGWRSWREVSIDWRNRLKVSISWRSWRRVSIGWHNWPGVSIGWRNWLKVSIGWRM